MKRFYQFLLPLLIFASKISQAQTAADVVVPITVTTSKNPASITLTWTASPTSTATFVAKKGFLDMQWTVLTQLPATATTFTDNTAKVGEAWEYLVLQQGTPQRSGVVFAGIELPPNVLGLGTMIFLVDKTLSAPLAAELAQFERDLVGDGWVVSKKEIDPATATVASVKAEILTLYDLDPTNSVAVLLFGNLPVPYSGDIAPDGHPDHRGAWPSDYYYGDLDEAEWTDATVNSTTATRPANRNVPGDGKFDQSQTPTLPELMVSRVDFSNMSAAWGVSQTELYRRYLIKNHRFRTGDYRPASKTLVDDNFGFFSGEAFAQSGWRSGYALTGPANCSAGDFFNDTDDKSYLVGYGCGGGTYQGASGVGTSANFQTDSVNVVFSMLFGSYHGDWDFETDPFMPAALASKGGILTCSWAGRPAWSYHHMGMGLPILYSQFWVYLNSFLPSPVYPPNNSDDLIHVSLLGDPTLRAHSVKPPTNVVATTTGTKIALSWTASPEATHGYFVYRAASAAGPYSLLNTTTVLGTNLNDESPLPGDNFYWVKAVRLEQVATGSYFNQSLGAGASAKLNPCNIQLEMSAILPKCNGGNDGQIDVLVLGATQPVQFLWSNGSNGPSLTDVSAGTYFLTLTDAAGCSGTSSIVLGEPTKVVATASATDVKCFGGSDGTATVAASGGTVNANAYQFGWSNGATTAALSQLSAQTITCTVSDANGCTATATATVGQPAQLVATATATDVKCFGDADGTASAAGSGGAGNLTFNWSIGIAGQNLQNLPAGNYAVTLTDANGCTAAAAATVDEPARLVALATPTDATCYDTPTGSLSANASGGTGNLTFKWSTGATSQAIQNLLAGDYSLTLTDANGCQATAEATVGEPDEMQITLSPIIASCNGATDGAVDLTLFNGQGNVEFEWSDGSIEQNLVNISSGNYCVTATDAKGCSATACTTVQENSDIAIVGEITSPACKGDFGSILIQISGGSPDYDIEWSDGTFFEETDGPAGNYSVTVTDGSGCKKIANFTMTEPDAIAITAVEIDPKCYLAQNGSIAATATGGTGALDFTWDTGDGVPTISGLYAGFYSLTVSDENGCEVSADFELVEPAWLYGSINSGGSFVPCVGALTISMTAQGGTLPYTFLWSNGTTNDSLTTAVAGDYSVTVTDANGCTTDETTTLFNLTPPTAGVSGDFYIPCVGSATITSNPSQGQPPYTYLWSTGETTKSISPGGAGTFRVTVTDARGCTGTGVRILENPSPLVVTPVLIVNPKCPENSGDGSIQVALSGGSNSLSILWSNGKSDNEITQLEEGNYLYTVTDGETGCTKTGNIALSAPNQPLLSISGIDTACVDVAQNFTLVGTATDIVWFAGGGGSITAGQGTATASARWSAKGTFNLFVDFKNVNGCTDLAFFSVDVDICVGTDDPTALAGVAVAPNPFEQFLTVKFENLPAENARLRLTDLHGRLIFENQIAQNPVRIETAELPAGAYFLQVWDGARFGVWKVLKI